MSRRYQRDYDGERRKDAARRVRRPLALDALRESPVRNGLIGLAVAGAAAPIAISRYQTALRTDPTHERVETADRATRMSDQTVSSAWRAMETEQSTAEQEREAVIQRSLEEYAEYDLTRELAEVIYDQAVEAGVDPELAFGLVRAESSFKNSSTSPVGAVGLTQLMPKTADWLEPGVTRSQLRDPSTNLRIGMKYLRQLIKKYDGNEDLALLAYNRGPGTVDRALKRGSNPDNGYADFVRGKEGHGHTLYTR